MVTIVERWMSVMAAWEERDRAVQGDSGVLANAEW